MVGQHIGKYHVTERIGRGGMGTVYRAVDETLHRDVAIKVLNTELNDPSVARRFRAEAVTVARLNHPGLATIYELVQHEGQWLMVMEFVRGETLEHLAGRVGALSVAQAADLCMQALGALAHAHSMGVVHRDLKPANIMLTEAGVIKIMDFGIARVAGTEHLTSAGFMMGTPAYMAPEQVLGHEIDARADLYAIGVVFYQLIAGTLPFKGDTPFQMAQSRISDEPTPVAAVRGDLPPWVREVLDVALARDPAARFQTALAFREALKRGLSGLPIGRSTPEAVPAELVTTAPPRSLPVLDPAADVTSAALPVVTPQPVPRPQAVVPTVAASPPARPPAPRAAGRRTTTLVAVAAIVVVVGLAAIWARSRALARPVEPPPAARASAAGTDNAATRSDVMLPSPNPARPEATAPEADAVGVAAATGSEAGGVPAACDRPGAVAGRPTAGEQAWPHRVEGPRGPVSGPALLPRDRQERR